MAQANTLHPVKIRSEPGIKRDGTQFEGDNYIDGQWCRFQRGLPRKIGGYRAITTQLPEIVRGIPVPSVLLSGDHAAVARWREAEARELTRRVRPDLVEG